MWDFSNIFHISTISFHSLLISITTRTKKRVRNFTLQIEIFIFFEWFFAIQKKNSKNFHPHYFSTALDWEIFFLSRHNKFFHAYFFLQFADILYFIVLDRNNMRNCCSCKIKFEFMNFFVKLFLERFKSFGRLNF